MTANVNVFMEFGIIIVRNVPEKEYVITVNERINAESVGAVSIVNMVKLNMGVKNVKVVRFVSMVYVNMDVKNVAGIIYVNIIKISITA